MNYSYQSYKKSVPLIILFSILTCGIYSLFWMYDITRQLSEINEDRSTSPGLVIVFSIITCGLYTLYWWYKIGGMFVESQARQNVHPIVDNKVLLLVLSIIGVSVVSMGILQSDLNRFWEKLDTNDRDGYSTAMDE
jgi:NADH:ubiquinone oxidoreductase subunit 5 (subunit L)/multisubunit Na+/H+ antiporter MnhA subunit